jgi:hypothetical protein
MRRRDLPFILAGLGLPDVRLNAVPNAADETAGRRALLIGIDRYANPAVPRLRGCQNDVEGLRKVLIGSYGFPEKQVLTLVNEKATYQRIRDAFESHLLKAPAGEVVVIQYSGHGSRQPSATSASGQGETIVPYDSRSPRNLDITSEALSGMVAELAKRTKNITVILDSCNSGRMVGETRAARGPREPALVREIPPPQDQPPPPPYAAPARSLTGAAGFAPLDDSYVLMASVLASQFAREYKSGSKHFGAMTYFLLREIASPAAKATYRNIMDVVAQRVSEAVEDQTPQVVGPHADTFLFGIESPPVVPYTIARLTGGRIQLPYAGTASGIGEGTRYDVYATPPQPNASPSAVIEVTKPDSFSSEARVASGTAPEVGYAVLRERGIQVGRLGLWIDPSPKLDPARSALEKDPMVQIVGNAGGANLKLSAEPGGMGLYTPDGLPMFDRESPIADAPALVRELKTWANWFAMQGLNNPQANIRIALRLEPVRDRGGVTAILPQLGAAEMTVKQGSIYEPVVTNDTDDTLYMTLLGMSSDRSISVIFPARADANAAFEVMRRSERRLPALRAEIPPCLQSSRDVLLLFASTQPVGFFPFVQNGFCEGSRRTMTAVDTRTPRVIPGPGKWATARRVVQIQK